MSTGLDDLFEKSVPQFVASLNQTVRDALLEYERMCQAGQKGELSYIYISLLLSSVICRLPWLRIDFCDENDRNDIAECCANWDVQFVSNALYRDIDASVEKKNMKDYEIEHACFDASSEYSQSFEKFLPQIIDQYDVVKEINCRWHFGQYLGNTIVVREKQKDEIL